MRILSPDQPDQTLKTDLLFPYLQFVSLVDFASLGYLPQRCDAKPVFNRRLSDGVGRGLFVLLLRYFCDFLIFSTILSYVDVGEMRRWEIPAVLWRDGQMDEKDGCCFIKIV